jgi:hypothetical protein
MNAQKLKTFDVWMEGRWVGITEGIDAKSARKSVSDSWPHVEPVRLLLTPFYGYGTSDETYEAITGCKPLLPCVNTVMH